MENKNIILTGIPRSGTSLTCRLLSQIDNVVALQEPMDVSAFGKMNSFGEIKLTIDNFFHEMRVSALERGVVISRHLDGRQPDNYFPSPSNTPGLRKGARDKDYISIGKPVTEDMMMIIKHPVAFTALVSNLKDYYPVYAVIRNPLWALASWSTTDINVRNGHAPVAENLDAKLAADLNSIEDRIDRQIFLLSWMFERYSMLKQEQIIYYENIIANPGTALSVITPRALALEDKLEASNLSSRYPNAPIDELKNRLIKKGGAFFDYYSSTDLK